MAGQPTTAVPLIGPRRLVVQLLGFALGLLLLSWCVTAALERGDWDAVRRADTRVVAALLGCTLASLLLNGATFWVTARPLRALPFWDLQRLNFVANMLNYAPVRLGVVARVAYHLRVDRLSLGQIAGWMAFVLSVVLLGAAACVLATVVHGVFDGLWLLLVAVQMAAGGLVARAAALRRAVGESRDGLGRILGDPTAVWGAIALRLGDLAAYSGRMAAALHMLEFQVRPSDVVILAVVALASSLTPLGRVGIREWSVAQAGALLGLGRGDVPRSLEQLALVESAGEALVLVPIGTLSLLWYWRRWARAPHDAGASPDEHAAAPENRP